VTMRAVYREPSLLLPQQEIKDLSALNVDLLKQTRARC